jgi:REP element-mobilizing transposase RayT
MPATLAYHLVKSAYGLWLPGDERGTWSASWDEDIGYIDPHSLHSEDPARLRMAAERMAHPPLRWNHEIQQVIASTIGECRRQSEWRAVAFAIEATHFHLIISYSGADIDRTAKWIAQQVSKAVHRMTDHQTPVFCKGRWREFIYENEHYRNLINYVENHNVSHGLSRRPYEWIGTSCQAGDGMGDS